jgi:anaerobic ribonucleoside-triphosphate reductase activating protein
MNEMNYADIKVADVANGEGVRVSLFVSGCNHHCKGCFNPQAWNFDYGNKFTEEEEEKIMKQLENPYVSGLSILGGEPLEYENQKGLLPLVKKVKEKYPEKNIWCYTGYTFDNDVVSNMFENWPETKELVSYIDVIVDGKFDESKKDLNLKFRGSSNQRVIDVQKSLKENKVILQNT